MFGQLYNTTLLNNNFSSKPTTLGHSTYLENITHCVMQHTNADCTDVPEARQWHVVIA